MSEHSVRLDSQSDEYVVASVVAVPPTWRDVWAIVRGRYEPRVQIVKRMTVKGAARMVREHYEKPLAELMRDTPVLP